MMPLFKKNKIKVAYSMYLVLDLFFHIRWCFLCFSGRMMDECSIYQHDDDDQ